MAFLEGCLLSIPMFLLLSFYFMGPFCLCRQAFSFFLKLQLVMGHLAGEHFRKSFCWVVDGTNSGIHLSKCNNMTR